jgi:flagellar biosynthetic protein FliQ
MTPSTVVDLMRQLLWTTFWISLPLLAIGFVAGLALSLLQIVTSIQDASFSAVPRLGVFMLGLLVSLPWMLAKLIHYTTLLFGDFARYAR